MTSTLGGEAQSANQKTSAPAGSSLVVPFICCRTFDQLGWEIHRSVEGTPVTDTA